MKPVDQIIFGGPGLPPEERGDCLRACFCSLLELPITALRCFHGEGWWERYIEELRPLGCYPMVIDTKGPLPGYWIAGVPSSVFPEGEHAVVMYEGEVAHDPSPASKVSSVAYPQEAIVLVCDDPARGATF